MLRIFHPLFMVFYSIAHLSTNCSSARNINHIFAIIAYQFCKRYSNWL